MMEPAAAELAAVMARSPLGAPKIPFVSNVTGTWIPSADARDPAYWARHLRQEVRFSAGIRELLGDSDRLLLEVGPGRALTTLALKHEGARGRAVSSLGSAGEPAVRSVLRALGELSLAGVGIDWSAVHAGERRRRVPLPTYPFERRRFSREEEHARPPTRLNPAAVEDWLYAPSCKRAVAPAAKIETAVGWLLVSDGSALADALGDCLRALGASPSVVLGDPERVVEALALCPRRVLHLGSGRDGFASALGLGRALARSANHGPWRVGLITSGVVDVLGNEDVCPDSATLLGLTRVIQHEVPHAEVQLFDMPAGGATTAMLDSILAELCAPEPASVVAWRGAHRFTLEHEKIHGAYADTAPLLRDGGVYLVVGGLGRIRLRDRERPRPEGSSPLGADRSGSPGEPEGPARPDGPRGRGAGLARRRGERARDGVRRRANSGRFGRSTASCTQRA